MDKSKILITFAGSYNIEARDGNDAMSGVSIEYYFWGENGETMQSKMRSDNVAGVRRSKGTLPFSYFESKLRLVPGIYEGTFAMKIGSDGKPTLQLTDIDFVADVSFKQLAKSATETKDLK